MPKLTATRKNIFAVAGELAIELGSPDRVTAAVVRRRIVDHDGRVDRFFAEWRERATGAPPAELRRAVDAVVEAFWRERNGAAAGRTAEAAAPPGGAARAAPRRRGRPAKAAVPKAPHQRGSFIAIHAARKGLPPVTGARPAAAGPYVRRSRKGLYKRRRITPEERKARQSSAAVLFRSLTGGAERGEEPSRRKVRRTDWERAVNPALAQAVATHLRDVGYALRTKEIHAHLVVIGRWAGGSPDRPIPGMLEGSRMVRRGNGAWWFDYEDPPYRSSRSRYRRLDSDAAAVRGLGELRFAEALDVLRKSRRPLHPFEIKSKLGGADEEFNYAWLHQRLRRESETADGAVEKTADGRYRLRKSKTPARGGRR